LTHFDERLFFWKTDAEYRRLLKARLAIDPSTTLKPIHNLYPSSPKANS